MWFMNRNKKHLASYVEISKSLLETVTEQRGIIGQYNQLVNKLLARGEEAVGLQVEVLESRQTIELLEKICDVLRMEAGLVAIKRELAEMNPAVRELRRLYSLEDPRS